MDRRTTGATSQRSEPPCVKCPFRKDVPIYLRTGRRQEIAENLLAQRTFWCHATVEHREDDNGEGWADTSESAECAGAVKSLMLVGGTTQTARVAERLGMVDLDAIESSPVEVWDLDTWRRLAEGATGDDPQMDEEAEVETCAVSDSGCLAPAGWLGAGGGVVRGTVAADGRCEACGDPVCSNCRHGEDGPCFDCLPEDEEWDGRSIV